MLDQIFAKSELQVSVFSLVDPKQAFEISKFFVKKKMEWLIIVISISTLASTLPVEKETSRFSQIILGLKMIVKSGLEKFILKSLQAGRMLFFLMNL